MISKDVVILTKDQLDEYERRAFMRGVERGRFEESSDRSRSESNQRQNGSTATNGCP